MDYKDTLNLPKTAFPMKANLSQREPEIMEVWEQKGIYERILMSRKDGKKYILHDGPPYANGLIHIGHALNKILKDIICRAKTQTGHYVRYVPGWDCHGLPIELQVDKSLGSKKRDMSKADIRKKCREYAEKYVGLQRDEFKRLGVFGLWDKPYLTMSYDYEATTLRELGRFVEKGLVYRGKKPVYWCASCRTALAEAEVEYGDKTSSAVFVKFPVMDTSGLFPINHEKGAYFIIWTTTPWTLPANLAIAVHPELIYCLVKTPVGDMILNKELVRSCMEKFGFKEGDFEIEKDTWAGYEFDGKIQCRHPWIDRKVRVIMGEHVTNAAGTGCVHIAPGHGQDDYELGLKYGLDILAPVDDRGRFTREVGGWEGVFVFDGNRLINERLREVEMLLAEEKVEHSYPHCWRCKKPVIFRATEQWFISLDAENLRSKALNEINKVEWIPSWGRERIYNMVLNRPDWCISRQRVWGIPIVAFYCKGCGKLLMNRSLIDNVVDIFEKGGADEWFIKDVNKLLPHGTTCPRCNGTEFTKEEDILDVWFDSGVSYAAVLENDEEFGLPADLYLEGSDQHRGWFHSSLLVSVATRGVAPYKTVLTHGFVMDGGGKKMSKSLGNVISPQEVIKRHGAEILRLWVAGEDYRDDMRISKEILSRLVEAYRRIRNTCRFMLGNLSDFDPVKDAVPYHEMEEIDRWALDRLAGMIDKVISSYDSFEFHVIYHSIHNFCVVDMSNFYLDVLKDRLYTFAKEGKRRRSAQTTIFELLNSIVRLIAPILPFTAEEIWKYAPSFPSKEESVHMALFPEIKDEWRNREISERWENLLLVKKDVARALEIARKEGIIGSSLEARVTLLAPKEIFDVLKGFSPILTSVFIVSQAELGEVDGLGVVIESEMIKGLKVGVGKAEGEKCERCWNYSVRVGEFKDHPRVCERCIEVL